MDGRGWKEPEVGGGGGRAHVPLYVGLWELGGQTFLNGPDTLMVQMI